MPDNQGFSATNFIKKQYQKSSSPDSENGSIGKDNNNPDLPAPVEVNENKTVPAKSKEPLSPETIRLIVKQNLDIAKKHLDSGRIWEAIGVYKANVQLAPQDLVSHQQLADALIRVNARTDAVDTLSKLAGILEREGKLERANEMYERIYGLDPTNELACSVLGRKPDHKIPYPDLPFSQPESGELSHEIEEKKELEVSLSAGGNSTMDKINQENKTVFQTEPPEIQEAFPIPEESIKKPVTRSKPSSQDDIPTVIQKGSGKSGDQEGPKPVEELVPLNQIPKQPVELKNITESKIDIHPKPKPPTVEPKPVDELIPFPPMPEKKEDKPPSSGISEPVEIPKKDIDLPKIEEAFPIPLPVLEDISKPVMESAKPVQPLSEPEPLPILSIPDSKSETGHIEETPVPESPIDRIQYYLDKLAMDPENIDARLKYIAAFLEIGLEQELVDDYLELANCYRNKGLVEEASRYYQKVLDLDPSVLEAERRLGILKGELSPTVTTSIPGAVDQKGETEGEARSTVPDLSEADSGQVEQFKRLLVLNPLNEPIARKLANFYRSKNRHKQAVDELNILADAYMQRGLYSKAEPIYAELVKEAPSDELKQKLAKSRSLKKSMDAINQAIKTYKTDLKTTTRKTP